MNLKTGPSTGVRMTGVLEVQGDYPVALPLEVGVYGQRREGSVLVTVRTVPTTSSCYK